ncbi:MAG: molybdopterin-binding protein [Archaeoglobaceae archaeon]|nr:molybdopterin-binding protein [Archaeoglobaceae archaeon]MCX8152037.1 molybdopterin-binding protein [Archaeoglobaceae archaeon]MDW8013594.1 molybdopterin-binding protein [Archaeoglobaceae archaeon]
MNFIIISVGNELLSGDTVNTNASYMAKRLTKIGHKVIRIIVVPDNVEDIASEVTEAMNKADFVLVTGGLGATHDDVTSEAIAKVFKVKLVINKKVYEWLSNFTKNENALRKISSVPEGAEIVWNDVGAAPAYIIGKIAVMPGVPAEMENTFEKILTRFEKLDFYEEVCRVVGYESEILDKLNRVVSEFPDVFIGSYPKAGHVQIKFSGSNAERVKAAKEMFEKLLNDQRKNIFQE